MQSESPSTFHWRKDLAPLIERISPIATGNSRLRVVVAGERLALALPKRVDAAREVIRLYQPQRMRGKLFRALALSQMHVGVPFLSERIACSSDVLPAADWLIPAAQAGTLGFMGCNPIHGPRCVFGGIDPITNQPLISKLGFDQSRASIVREYEITRHLSERYRGVLCPEAILTGDDWAIIKLPFLGYHSPSSMMDPLLERLLSGWTLPDERQLGSVSFIHELLERIPEGCAPRNWHERVRALSIQSALIHGDFAVWNTRQSLDASGHPQCGLSALDWEWAVEHGIAGIDLAHALRQESFMVQRMQPQAAVNWILKQARSPLWSGYLKRAGWEGNLIDWLRIGLLHSHFNTSNPSAELLETLGIHVSTDTKLATCKNKYEVGYRFANHFSEESKVVSHPCMKISIVTPCYRQVEHLRRCAASIRDQEGDFEVEHLVHDAQSGADFDEWASQQQFSSCVSEPDHGMYDAINRGFKRASGDIIAWLNCDEQYLPGALAKVAEFFRRHPQVDILFGDIVLVDEDMQPLAYRRAVRPSIGHIRYSHLSTFTAATFVRRRAIDEGIWLDTRWKTISDAVWVDGMLSAGYRSATLHEPLAVFTMLGSNLGQSTKLHRERRAWEQANGCIDPWIKLYYIYGYRLAKFMVGAYLPRFVRVAGYRADMEERTQQSRWLLGFWSAAREQVDQQRVANDGAFSILPIRPVLKSYWAYAYAVLAVILGLLSDFIPTGESVKAPLVMIFAMLLLTLRAKTRDLILISAIFFIFSAYSLRNRPVDIFVVRLLTFIISSFLSYLLSRTLRDVEQWMRVTVGLTRRIPQPILLANRDGEVVLVNESAENLLHIDEASLLGYNLSESIHGVGISQIDCMINTWEDRPPASEVTLTLSAGQSSPRHVTANVFMVGTGKRRLFGFSMNPPLNQESAAQSMS